MPIAVAWNADAVDPMCLKSKRFSASAIPEICGNETDTALVYARLLYRKLVSHRSRLIGFHLINADDVGEDPRSPALSTTASSIFGLPLESIESERCESASSACCTSGKGFR